MLRIVVLACVWTARNTDAENNKSDATSRLVHIDQGPMYGYKDVDTGIYIFHGIPYATAPKGNDKFKAPLPAPTWTDPLEAVDKGIICPQGFMAGPSFENKTKQEDCLIANVYVPDTNEQNVPVVVYVHGGAFQVAFGNLGTPKYLVKSKRVIAVNFNYRLGIHGFLCLGTKDVPGNAGMKDQVALLRWVNKNIAAFGGNPNEVTVAGYSAGSVAVDLLMISPLTKGLFKRVIPESGANVAVWSIQMDPLENAKNHAKTLNFTNVDDIHALEEFYKTASYDLLTSDIFFEQINSTFVFTPCIEQKSDKEERFLVDSPLNILKTGNYLKLPMLYGFSNMEGIFRIPSFESWKDKMNEKFSDFLPADLQFENDQQKETVAESVKQFYFGNKLVGNDTALSYIDYFTDILFAYGTLRSAKLQVAAGNNQLYLYEYSYVDDAEIPIPLFPNIRGANHCAQTDAVLDGKIFMNIDENTLSEENKKMKAVMRDMWLNFMTGGKPVPEGSTLPVWPPVDADGSPHMSLGQLGSAEVKLSGPLLQRRARFWDDIYDKYYRQPIPPSLPASTK